MTSQIRKVTLWKVTDRDGKTRANTQWGSGITNRPIVRYCFPDSVTGSRANAPMCTDAWIHAYESKAKAYLFKSGHLSQYKEPYRLWEAEGVIEIGDQMKVATTELTTIREVEWPKEKVDNSRHIYMAVLTALQCSHVGDVFRKFCRPWIEHGREAVLPTGDELRWTSAVDTSRTMIEETILDMLKYAKESPYLVERQLPHVCYYANDYPEIDLNECIRKAYGDLEWFKT